MMFIAASWPSNSEAAVTKRKGVSTAGFLPGVISDAGRLIADALLIKPVYFTVYTLVPASAERHTPAKIT
jgi:hypothetical protein